MQIKITDDFDATHVDITYWIRYYNLYQKNLSQIISDFDKTETGKLSIIGTTPDKMFIEKMPSGYAREPEHKFYNAQHIKKIEEEINLVNHLVKELIDFDANKALESKTVG